jgi:hypothetical protein
MNVCWSAEDVVAAISALPSCSSLPVRTILVPNARMARGLRERLVAAGRSDLLAGTRFMTPEVLAAAVLNRAGVAVEFLEDDLRPHRIAQLIADGIDPPGLGRALLQETVGWAAALATTIGELERADLRPSDLPSDDVMFDAIRKV